jgi:Ca2+-binding RTX toxin-like protein
MAVITIPGSNRFLLPASYTYDDELTFLGTRGNDILFGGGGELYTIFRGTPGDDLYGVGDDAFSITIADYRRAPGSVYVNLSIEGGQRRSVDEHGDTRTVALLGMARDGFGDTDWFAASPFGDGESAVTSVYGSRFDDTMISTGFAEFFGGAGNDRLTGFWLHGGAGNDVLISAPKEEPADYWPPSHLRGGAGDDFLWATRYDGDRLSGGSGNDRIFARGGDDVYVTGEAGDDYVDGGSGNDFIDGGKGSDILVSGEGSDIINPDVEYFQLRPNQARDQAKDTIIVSRDDLGDDTDYVLSRSFEAGRDEVNFHAAVWRGPDYRIFHQNLSINPDTGQLYDSNDLAGRRNTVLQIDQNGDGFGARQPDTADYFLIIVDADLSIEAKYTLC